MSTDIETAFHTSLDRLLRGEATLDACVAAYPEHEERLREMLVVALDLQALAPLPLDRQAVERGARLIDDELQHLRARLDQQPEPASVWERLTWWFPRFMPVRMAGLAAAFAIALIAYGGVTLAAVNSGPGSALYGYRLTLEELRIGFAPNEEKAYLYLDTAEQRLREIESAAGLGDTGAVARASTAYQEVVRKGVDVLGAVAREQEPGAQRTGDVAADYRRRLAEHDTRFNSLTHSAPEAERAPISRARSQVQAGLQDVHSGPILKAAPTATPDPGLTPTVSAPAPAPTPSPGPSPSPTATSTPAPTASPTPVAVTATPTPQATPEPTATPVPAIDITGSAVVVTGELNAVTDSALVVAGISIGRGSVAAVDAAPLAARVRAEAQVAADGSLTLVALVLVDAAPAVAQAVPVEQPDASPSPQPTPGATATATPEASPTAEPTASDGTPAPDASPTPTAAEVAPTATPEAGPTEATTPGEGEPAATPEATPTAEPTPTVAEGTPSPTPETTLSPEATPADATSPPPDESQTTPEPSVTPTPEATSTPDAPPAHATPTPAPTESAPTATPAAVPSPEPPPAATEPPADATPPPDVSPTPTPGATETPTPTADTASPSVPAPPTLQGILVSIDSFSVRAGGIVFSRPLDTPLVLHGPLAPGEVVVVTFEALRAASSYVLVAREVAPVQPPDGAVVTRWQGFVGERTEDALTLNGVRVQVPPEAREDDVWASLEAGALVEIELRDAAAGEPEAAALRLLGSSAAQTFSSLAGPPLG